MRRLFQQRCSSNLFNEEKKETIKSNLASKEASVRHDISSEQISRQGISKEELR
jgi:hypothetical protein